jgi:hypothetical protein
VFGVWISGATTVCSAMDGSSLSASVDALA